MLAYSSRKKFQYDVFAHKIFFSDVQSSFRSDSASPVPCAPPEYLIAPYRAGDYEYVGVPLDHTQTDEESSGPSTAEIIANQSQDYIDEKLAEYQATIQQLQGELAMKRNEFVSIVRDGNRSVTPFLLEADENCMYWDITRYFSRALALFKGLRVYV
jgi:hypothetical protein